MEDKTIIDKRDIGFTSPIFTFFPLPRKNTGKEWIREANGIKCTYSSKEGVPYSMLDRKWLEILTTQARRSSRAFVDMGSVQSALNTYGMGESGFYIKPTVESLKRIGGLFIHTERTNDINYKGKIYKQYQAINMTLAKKVQITWGHGRLKNQPLELDGFTYFDFSDDFYQTFIKTAVPHIQSQYLEIKAPIEQDLYVWLAQKLFTLKDETEKIPWTWLFTQFAPKAILKGDALQHAKTNIKNALLRIQRDFYKTAKFEFTYEGVILKKSPPLIEPGDKKAGYAPGRAWDQEQVGDIPEWKPPKLSIPMMEFTDEELEIPGKNLPLP